MIFHRLRRTHYVSFILTAIVCFGCNQDITTTDKLEIESIESTKIAEIISPTNEQEGPRPRIGNDEDRMAEPIMPPNPAQADLGTVVYWLTCMACHGDKGQGLTDEWRVSWGPEEMNCWQSKCHASNHPPEGFVLLRYAPSLIYPNALARFNTAQDYFDYISTEMPWWNPASLQEEEYWQVTAFLLRENGVDFIEGLNANNASRILIGE